MGSSIVLAAVAAALTIKSANPTAPATLKPSSNWNVEYADNMCLLTRDFGEGDDKVTLGFKPGPASEHLRVILLTRDVAAKVDQGEAQLNFDDRAAIAKPFLSGPVKKEPLRVTAIDLKREDIAPLVSAKQLQVKAGRVDVALAPTHVAAAMSALTSCENDLLVTWGMDAAVVASIVQRPKINRSNGAAAFFSVNDYPEEALRRREQGTTGARVFVGTDGRVTGCVVMESSSSPSIDAQTCNIIQSRFRFEPARTADGKAVPSFTYQRVRWEMP